MVKFLGTLLIPYFILNYCRHWDTYSKGVNKTIPVVRRNLLKDFSAKAVSEVHLMWSFFPHCSAPRSGLLFSPSPEAQMSRSESLETKKDARKRILYLALNFFVNHTSIKPVKTPLIYQHTNDNDTIIILHTFQAFQLIRLPEAFLYWVCWCPWRELVWQTQWPERSCPLGAPLEMDLSC